MRAGQPWRERPTELLLWTLFRLGRQREALEAFEATRRALADELGVDPDPALRRMHQRVLQQDPTLLPTHPAPSARVVLRPDAFVGRRRELEEVAALLRDHRLVTLTGPAGSGKTRLAEEVAARSGEEAVLVDLAPVDDPGLVPATIAARLGLATGEPSDVLVAALAHRPLLLVLDNVEHLRGVAAAVATLLLRNTTELRLLLTSREPVRLTGEQLYAVSPLAVPPAGEHDLQRLADTAGVQLLLARAQERDPAFRLTDGNADTLGHIVRTLDGLPLALEIIAPWLRPLGPHGVLTQLSTVLDIPGRRDDADRRHRTLREAIAWSYERLGRDEQKLLGRLSVLRGGGDLEAVRAVGGTDLGAPVVDVLVELVDRHLVQPPATTAGPPRFRMLETVRRFAAERLAAEDAEATEARAAEWFGRWAVWLAANSEGPATGSWQEQAVTDADNLRAAMDFLERTGRTGAHLQLVVDTMALWFEAGHEREGEVRLERALSAAPAESTARAMGLAYLAWLVAGHDRGRATELARDATDLARRDEDDPVLGFALQALGESADDVAVARAASTEALGVARRVGHRHVHYGPTAGDAVAVGATYNLAAVEAHRALPVAVDWQRRALSLAEEEGDRRIIAANTARLGLLHLLGADVASAAGAVGRAVGLVTGPLTARWEDIVRFAQGQLLHHEGRTDEAGSAYRALVTSALAGGRVLHVVLGSCALADLLTDRGLLDEAAATLRGAQSALRGTVDRHHLARFAVRKARLLRLDGRPAEAEVLLDRAHAALDEAALSPTRITWLVEQVRLRAMTDPRSADEHRAELARMSQRTGVRVPPWEGRCLDAARTAGAPDPGIPHAPDEHMTSS